MPDNPVESLLRQVNACVAATGLHLSQAPDIEAAIPVLQDLSALRSHVQEILEKHRRFFDQMAAAPEPTPLAASPVKIEPEKIEPEKIEDSAESKGSAKIEEAPRERSARGDTRGRGRKASARPAQAETETTSETTSETTAETTSETTSETASSPSMALSPPRKRGRPTEATGHTPLQMYRPFILRAMRQLQGSSARYADIQRKALALMKDAGVATPQDEEPVGASGVIRYIAQSGAAKKQLLHENLIEGSGAEGFTLTPKGQEELDKLSS